MVLFLKGSVAISDDYFNTITEFKNGEIDRSNYGSNNHNCRFWAVISENVPDGVILNQLVVNPKSLKYLSTQNVDGWGIAYYLDTSDSIGIVRGRIRANNDPDYDLAVAHIDSLNPDIVLAHIRNCSSGCCCNGCDSIANPHPFLRFKNNEYWTFAHNGHIDKAVLYDLTGNDYLLENPPNGSNLPECDPADTSLIIDSELYFIYLLKSIEESGWNVAEGIINAINDLVYPTIGGAYNFILSNGSQIWAYRKGNTLFYFNDTENNYCAVASMFPDIETDNWQAVPNYGLAVFSSDAQPEFYDPLFVPGDVNGDKMVIGSDITYGVAYFCGQVSPPPDSFFIDGSWLYAAADVNGNCEFLGSDIVYLVRYFQGAGTAPIWCPQIQPY